MERSRGARITPGGGREIGALNGAIVRVLGLATGGRPANVFTTLARNRRLFRRWLWFAAALMPGGKLPRVDTELIILRVAANADSEYEWIQHERLGRRAGLTPAEIERVRSGPEAEGWSARQRLFLRAADEMHGEGRIGDGTWDALAAELDDRLMIELCMLIGHYEMLAMTLNSLGVEPEKRGG
jgi:alkylhydroperoxidase family enzyme